MTMVFKIKTCDRFYYSIDTELLNKRYKDIIDKVFIFKTDYQAFKFMIYSNLKYRTFIDKYIEKSISKLEGDCILEGLYSNLFTVRIHFIDNKGQLDYSDIQLINDKQKIVRSKSLSKLIDSLYAHILKRRVKSISNMISIIDKKKSVTLFRIVIRNRLPLKKGDK